VAARTLAPRVTTSTPRALPATAKTAIFVALREAGGSAFQRAFVKERARLWKWTAVSSSQSPKPERIAVPFPRRPDTIVRMNALRRTGNCAFRRA
jgi:hypothetical protein